MNAQPTDLIAEKLRGPAQRQARSISKLEQDNPEATVKKIEISVQTLPHFEGMSLPSYESIGAAGMDLRAALNKDTPLLLTSGMRSLIPTGLSIALPKGFEAQIRPRSGLAFKFGITCLNSPGTIDSDYRGEIKVLLINHGQEDFLIKRGERIAQMVIAPVIQTDWQICDSLPESKRAKGGFGSTGRK